MNCKREAPVAMGLRVYFRTTKMSSQIECQHKCHLEGTERRFPNVHPTTILAWTWAMSNGLFGFLFFFSRLQSNAALEVILACMRDAGLYSNKKKLN